MFSALPLAPSTDAGIVLRTEVREELERNYDLPEGQRNSAKSKTYNLVVAAQIIARDWLLRVPAAFLFAGSLVAFFGFLAAEFTDHKFLAMFSIIAALVSAIHYRAMAKLRSMRGTHWLGFDAQNDVREMAIDSFRYSNWLVVRVLCVLQILAIANHEPHGKNYDNIMLSAEATAGVAGLGILLAAYVRIGTDELWDTVNNHMVITASGYVLYAGSLACLTLVILELMQATDGIEDNNLLQSFFFVWIGYPVVEVASIIVRMCTKGRLPPGLSVFKDIVYAGFDCYTVGLLAVWVGYSCFGDRRIFNNPAATPYALWPA